MFFGKYLVENNKISDQELISCMLEQVKSLPSSLESIIEVNILTSNEMVDLVSNSVERSKDILSLLSEFEDGQAKVTKVLEHQNRCSKNLAEIILSKTSLSKDELTEIYEKYNRDNSQDISVNSEPADVTEDSPISAAALESLQELQGGDVSIESLLDENNKTEVKIESDKLEAANDISSISAAALESLKELGGVSESDLADLENSVDSSIVIPKENVVKEEVDNEYAKIFTEAKNRKLSKIINMIDEAAKSDDDIGNYFNSLYKELHIIKGATALVDVRYSKKLIDIWELIIDKVFKMEREEIKAWVFSYLENLKSSVDVLWNIRMSLTKGNSEEEYMKDDSVRDKYIANISGLKNIISEIS